MPLRQFGADNFADCTGCNGLFSTCQSQQSGRLRQLSYARLVQKNPSFFGEFRDANPDGPAIGAWSMFRGNGLAMSDAPSNSDQATFIGPAAAPLAALSFRRDWECGIRPDVGEFLTSKGDLPASEVVAVLRVDQELRWQTGERPTVAEYLGRFSTISKNPEHLWNLVQNEFLIRSELGEEPSVSQYVEEFPQLRDRLRSLLKPSNGHAAFKLSNSPNSLLNSRDRKSVV